MPGRFAIHVTAFRLGLGTMGFIKEQWAEQGTNRICRTASKNA
jgi:hypothetical protein